jgi:hypothetical protein
MKKLVLLIAITVTALTSAFAQEHHHDRDYNRNYQSGVYNNGRHDNGYHRGWVGNNGMHDNGYYRHHRHHYHHHHDMSY